MNKKIDDTLMIKKLQDSPERYAFYVDVGDMPPEEALELIKTIRERYRKRVVKSG